MSTSHLPSCPVCNTTPEVRMDGRGYIVIRCGTCGASVSAPRRITALLAWREHCRGVVP